jgi:hypothetical protein
LVSSTNTGVIKYVSNTLGSWYSHSTPYEAEPKRVSAGWKNRLKHSVESEPMTGRRQSFGLLKMTDFIHENLEPFGNLCALIMLLNVMSFWCAGQCLAHCISYNRIEHFRLLTKKNNVVSE